VTHTGTVVTMFSHVSRETERAQTIKDFARVGCPVAHVQLQETAPRMRENRRNAAAALRAGVRTAVEADAVGVLLVEDDVDPADSLAEWLTHLEAHSDHITTLYVPDQAAATTYPQRLARVARGERKPRKSELVPVVRLKEWWGSQALWFPLDLAYEVASDARMQMHEHGLGPFDITLRAILAEWGATLQVAVPNVVQHRAPPNLVTPSRPPNTSAAFSRGAPAPAVKEG